MSRLITICAFICVLALAGCQKTASRGPVPAGWQEFKPTTGDFSVVLPVSGVPVEEINSIDLGVGRTIAHDYNLIIVSPGIKTEAFLTSYTDFQPGEIAKLGESQFLEKIWTSTYATLPGPVIYKRETTYQGHTALEFQIHMGKILIGASRYVIVGDRLYMLTAMLHQDRIDSGDATTYLDSLQID